jgi:DNA-binding GntR family transcriptional regulator
MTRSTLAESVADVLRHAIFQGAYLCGERLVELTIAQEMNVSQNTVREALRLLEQDGLVVKRARYGTHIRSYTPDEALELYALWSAVESLALGWAMARITDDHLAHLARLVARMRGSILADREREALEIRFQLHTTLAEIAGRPQTGAILQRLHNQIRLLENLRQAETLHTLEYQDTQIRHCQALVDAIRLGDREQAQAHLHACIEADREAVAAVLG